MINKADQDTLNKMLTGSTDGYYEDTYLVRAMETLYDDDEFIKLMSAHLTSVQGVPVDFDEILSEACWLVDTQYPKAYSWTCNWDLLATNVAEAVILSGNAVLSQMVVDAVHTEEDKSRDREMMQNPYW